MDPSSPLLEQRIILIATAVDDALARVVTAQLLFLQHEDPRADIRLYVNSPGGSVTASLAIHDMMRFVKNDVATFAVGQARGTALLLLAAGRKGKRFVLPHARTGFADILLDPARSRVTDETEAAEIARLRDALVSLFHEYAGLPTERIESELGAGRVFDAETTIKLGLADEILSKDELPDLS